MSLSPLQVTYLLGNAWDEFLAVDTSGAKAMFAESANSIVESWKAIGVEPTAEMLFVASSALFISNAIAGFGETPSGFSMDTPQMSTALIFGCIARQLLDGKL